MCDDAVAEFACADRYEARGEQLEAGLMIGKTMMTLRTVLSAEEKALQRHHKFKEDNECLKLLNIYQ